MEKSVKQKLLLQGLQKNYIDTSTVGPHHYYASSV